MHRLMMTLLQHLLQRHSKTHFFCLIDKRNLIFSRTTHVISRLPRRFFLILKLRMPTYFLVDSSRRVLVSFLTRKHNFKNQCTKLEHPLWIKFRNNTIFCYSMTQFPTEQLMKYQLSTNSPNVSIAIHSDNPYPTILPTRTTANIDTKANSYTRKTQIAGLS